jgi:hypothetical protein
MLVFFPKWSEKPVSRPDYGVKNLLLQNIHLFNVYCNIDISALDATDHRVVSGEVGP